MVRCDRRILTIKQLARIGFDHVIGHVPGTLEWITTGRSFDMLPPIDAETVKGRTVKSQSDEGRGFVR